MSNPTYYCLFTCWSSSLTIYSKVLDILLFFNEVDRLKDVGKVPHCKLSEDGCITDVSVALLKHGGWRFYLTFATGFLAYGILALVALMILIFVLALLCTLTMDFFILLGRCGKRLFRGSAPLQEGQTTICQLMTGEREEDEGPYFTSKLPQAPSRQSGDCVFALLGLGVFIAPVTKGLAAILRFVALLHVIYWSLRDRTDENKPRWGAWVTLPETLLSGQFLWLLTVMEIAQGKVTGLSGWQKAIVGPVSIFFAYQRVWNTCFPQSEADNGQLLSSPSAGNIEVWSTRTSRSSVE